MRRQQVVVRCVSEFAMGLRELALIGQGAAWLPRSLITDDLRRGRLRPLPTLGRSVAMDIVVYIATLDGDEGAGLVARFEALRDLGARTRRRPRRR
jgi:DNA-binding transcriptional LysR family regulator